MLFLFFLLKLKIFLNRVRFGGTRFNQITFCNSCWSEEKQLTVFRDAKINPMNHFWVEPNPNQLDFEF